MPSFSTSTSRRSGAFGHRLRQFPLTLAAAIAFLFIGSAAQAQITIYAKFLDGAGNWAGELTGGRQGWTALESAVVSFSNPTAIGGATAPVNFNPVILSKAVNKLTPQIFASTVLGTAVRNLTLPADLTLEYVTEGPAGPVVFFRVEMRYLIFTSQKTATSTGSDAMQEDVEIQFGSVRLTSWPISPAGTQGTPKTDTWNRIKGTNNFNDVP